MKAIMNTKYSAADILGMMGNFARLANKSTLNIDKFKLSFQGTQLYQAVPPRIWPKDDGISEVEDKICRLDNLLTDEANRQIILDKTLANTPDSKFSTGCGFLGQVGVVRQCDPTKDVAVAVSFRYYYGAHIGKDKDGVYSLTASGHSDLHLHDQAMTCAIVSDGDLRDIVIAVDLKVIACMAFHMINKTFVKMWDDDTIDAKEAIQMNRNHVTDEQLRKGVMKQHLVMMKDGEMMPIQMRTIRAVLDHVVGEFNEYLDIDDSIPAHERATMYHLVARALTVWMDYQGDVIASVIRNMISYAADLYCIGGSVIEELYDEPVAMMLQECAHDVLRIKVPEVTAKVNNETKHPKYYKVKSCRRDKGRS